MSIVLGAKMRMEPLGLTLDCSIARPIAVREDAVTICLTAAAAQYGRNLVLF